MISFEKVKPSVINSILTEIFYSIQTGRYIIPFSPVEGVSLYFSSIDMIVLREMDIFSREKSKDDLILYLLQRSFIGWNNSFLKSDLFLEYHNDCEAVYNLIKEEGLSQSFFNFIVLLNKAFGELRYFVPTFCDTIQAKELWGWYKLNSSRRVYSGMNPIEMDFVYYMNCFDRDLAFENFKFLGSHWSKGGAKIKTSVQNGFSWLHRFSSGGDKSMSVTEMEEMMQRYERGEKDHHERAMDIHAENQRRFAEEYFGKVKKEQQERQSRLKNLEDDFTSID